MRFKHILWASAVMILMAGSISPYGFTNVQAQALHPEGHPPDDPFQVQPTPQVPPTPTSPDPAYPPPVQPGETVVDLSAPQDTALESEQASEPSTQFLIYFPNLSTLGSSAFHRSGQTFLTWPERRDIHGEKYTIYRAVQPITSENLSQASKIATVGKNSAAFYTNRYNLNGTTSWYSRYSDRLIVDPGAQPVLNGWGLFVWTVSPQDLGGKSTGNGYYAVTITPAGGEEMFLPSLTSGPISETVADPSPVEITSSTINIGDGGHVYIQYMDFRNWNATFHAPNPSNNYYGMSADDPDLANNLQYAYDYAVFTPSAANCKGRVPEPLPLLVHLHGWKGNTSTPEWGYPDPYCAYGLYPIDVSDTWYFGFARQKDYRQGGEPGAGDTIVNYTEQRILRMIYDLMRNPPGPAVDPLRIYVAGQSMGGTGSLAFAERYPNLIAAAYASQPMTDFHALLDEGTDWAGTKLKWGSPSLNLPIYLDAPAGWANTLKRYDGVSVWTWQNLQTHLNPPIGSPIRPRILDEMAPFGIIHDSQDPVVRFDTQGKPIYTALNASNRVYGGMVTKDPNEPYHKWWYYIGMPTTLMSLGATKYTWVPFYGLKVVRNETVPGLSNLSTNSGLPAGASAQYNQTILWSSSWNPWDGLPIDQQDMWQTSLCSTSSSSILCGTGIPQTVDVTPRRMQHFMVRANTTYRWQNYQVADGALIGSGYVKSDGNGILTVPGFQVSPTGNRLVIIP